VDARQLRELGIQVIAPPATPTASPTTTEERNETTDGEA
jgi:hypothetical protein